MNDTVVFYIFYNGEQVSVPKEVAEFLEDDLVGLRVPCIRLQEVGERRPLLRVLQNGAAVHQEELRVTGNDLCLTTRSRFLPLRDMNFDFNAPPRLRVEITYLDKPLHDSGQKLERDFLLFDPSGNDRAVKTGRPSRPPLGRTKRWRSPSPVPTGATPTR